MRHLVFYMLIRTYELYSDQPWLMEPMKKLPDLPEIEIQPQGWKSVIFTTALRGRVWYRQNNLTVLANNEVSSFTDNVNSRLCLKKNTVRDISKTCSLHASLRFVINGYVCLFIHWIRKKLQRDWVID